MAFTEFYVDSSGSNLNAGTVQSAAASVTSTNGNWSTVTNIFTPAGGGTPFSGVSAGEYASIYLDAASVTTFVAKIASVDSGGATITLDATIRWGTPPTTGATGRSCKVGGSHLNEIAWSSTGLTGTIPASTRVNWKKGTYTVTASRTISVAGTAALPIWFRGYDTTPGDCDSDPSLTRPSIALNAGIVITDSGANHIWSSLNISGNRGGTIWAVSGAGTQFFRCRIENTSSNTLAIAVSTSTSAIGFFFCWIKTPSTAATTGTMGLGSITQLVGCVIEGGGNAAVNALGNDIVVMNCIILNTVIGILFTTGRLRGSGITFYNCSSDAIKWGTTVPSGSFITDCIFSVIGGSGINNATGTNTSVIYRSNNLYHSITGAVESGMGDYPDFFQKTDSSSPFTAAGSNFGIVSSSNARNNGFAPGGFEGYSSTISYDTIGAVEPLGGSSGFIPQVFK